MNKYLVLYRAPLAVLDDWMKKPEEERKEAEGKMMLEWQEWMKAHADTVKETMGAGKTTRITAGGSDAAKNDIMLYSLVEAESDEAAMALFANHPHLGIPEASIEIMPAKPVMGM